MNATCYTIILCHVAQLLYLISRENSTKYRVFTLCYTILCLGVFGSLVENQWHLSQLEQSVHSYVSTLLRITLSARRHKKDQSTNYEGLFVPLSSCRFLKYSQKHPFHMQHITVHSWGPVSVLVQTHYHPFRSTMGTHSSTSCLICKTSHWSLLALPHACLLPSQVWFISWHVTICIAHKDNKQHLLQLDNEHSLTECCLWGKQQSCHWLEYCECKLMLVRCRAMYYWLCKSFSV